MLLRYKLTGARFGRWTVLSKGGRAAWLCRCDCGAEREVLSGNLRNGVSQSCGCLKRELTIARSTKHGHCVRGHSLKLYWIFADEKYRCTNVNHPRFADYGGRGIQFRFVSFKQWLSELGPRPEGLTADRINNNGHYEPGNMRWATYKEQNNNKRRHGGKKL